MTRSREHARLLLTKADEDLYVLERLAGEDESPDAVIGFHAQQAAEKSLKAVLTARGIRYAWTHDLGALIDLLTDHSIPAPPEPDRLPALTPFAAEFRYGQLPPEDAPARVLDRRGALESARRTREWAEGMVAGQSDTETTA
jgi:HEPN domain-containing protein